MLICCSSPDSQRIVRAARSDPAASNPSHAGIEEVCNAIRPYLLFGYVLCLADTCGPSYQVTGNDICQYQH